MEKEKQTASAKAADSAEEIVKADGGAEMPAGAKSAETGSKAASSADALAEAASTEGSKTAVRADTLTEAEDMEDGKAAASMDTTDSMDTAASGGTVSAAARTGAQTAGTPRTAKKRASGNARTSSSTRNNGGARAAGNTRTSANTRDKALQSWMDEMPDGSAKHYLESRVLPQMRWYADKSAMYKNRYQCLMWITIALGAMIPVFSVFNSGGNFMKAWVAFLGSAVTAVNALLSLHNFKDLWLTYRNTREDLLRTLYYYFNNAGVFEGDDPQEKKDTLLVKVCEDRMGQESGGWKSLLDK